MRRPISLKVYSIALGLLVLMVVVTGLSARNLKILNNEVAALSGYYIPLDQQIASVETLVRQQVVHFERILLLMQARDRDRAALEQEQRLFDQRGVNADQVVDSSLRLVEQALGSREVDVDRVAFAVLKNELPDIQTARQHFHATFRQFLIEAEEGNPRSLKVVREAMVREKDAINARVEKVILALQKVTQDAADNARTEEEKAIRLNWGITLIAGVLGLIFAAVITRNLVQPVRRLLSGTRAVEEGDLSIRIQASSADEIAALTESFNNMVAGLREKERIKDTFGKYVDPRIVKGLLENRLSSSGGEKRVMTVFFSDLVGFTALGEQLTPDGVVRFLNQYFTLMSEPIREYGGILDKFIGDAIMAYWGPPFTGEKEHAALACFSALDQMARLEQFRRMLPDIMGLRKGLPAVNIRMGIATGDVTVGTIGSESAKGFTVIGDTVNLASRLEGANKEYGTTILINEDTWRLAADAVESRELDSIRVVGKSEPVRVFELLGRKGQLDPAVLELKGRFEQGLGHYRSGAWDEAEKCFNDCLKLKPDDAPARLLISRVRQLRADPSARQADGVWTLTKK
ncbi:MAG TPA: adenylate/guanylate cyclase domain-containing protein [Burkholderiales bacterium]|nr:adenylate/guanylate cyclase domain-containing protein [Burkholderiales bacterium]